MKKTSRQTWRKTIAGILSWSWFILFS